MTGDQLKTLIRRLSLDRPRNVGAVLDLLRCSEPLGPTPMSARRLYLRGEPASLPGSRVARSFGYLAHYTTVFPSTDQTLQEAGNRQAGILSNPNGISNLAGSL